LNDRQFHVNLVSAPVPTIAVFDYLNPFVVLIVKKEMFPVGPVYALLDMDSALPGSVFSAINGKDKLSLLPAKFFQINLIIACNGFDGIEIVQRQ
jgi:hypothetical protein